MNFRVLAGPFQDIYSCFGNLIRTIVFLEGEPEALAEVLTVLDQGFWLFVGLWASEAPVWPDWCSASGRFSNLHSGSLELSQHHVLL